MEYDSIDIAVGYKTRVIDLNRYRLPADMMSRYDTVLNAGTSEHILNQMNSFRCIHDAAKVGGLIVHHLPSVGYTDHCYFTYNPRFFFDLAGFNGYEIVDFRFTGPSAADPLLAGLRAYQTYFPSVGRYLDRTPEEEWSSAAADVDIPNFSIYVVYRKVNDAPFLGTLETSTSWGESGAQDVGGNVMEGYKA